LKFLTGLNIVTLFVPKGKRNGEHKAYLNEETILCLLDDTQLDTFAGTSVDVTTYKTPLKSEKTCPAYIRMVSVQLCQSGLAKRILVSAFQLLYS